MLSYNPEQNISEPSFFDMIRKHATYSSDYPEWAQSDLKWLIERGSISIDKNNLISIVFPRILVLQDLYNHEVICTSHWNKEMIDKLVSSGDLRYGNSLFSEPEQKYFNYMLNKAEFSNGLDLRNRYIHGVNTLDEQQHNMDYIIILKLMIIIIIKINEEFCLAYPEQDAKDNIQDTQ